jgi:iron complex transport system permease protein
MLIVLMAAALAVGQFPIAANDLVAVIWGKVTGVPNGAPETIQAVIFQVRAPRILAAVLTGAALAASGATFQVMFRNPLVSPDILGISAGAALGACLAIFLSLPILAVQFFAFAGGVLAVLMVYALGITVRGHDPMLTLILTGIVTGAFLGSGIALVKYLADPYNQLPAITFWMLGSLADMTLPEVASMAVLCALSVIPIVLLRWRINLLALSDDEARALGVNVNRLRIAVVASATLMTAAVVAVTGIIGWIGLIVPHAARLLAGPQFARLLPVSMLLGAVCLLGVDTLARSVASIEIPPGVLTAILGAPLFLWLLAKTGRGQE